MIVCGLLIHIYNGYGLPANTFPSKVKRGNVNTSVTKIDAHISDNSWFVIIGEDKPTMAIAKAMQAKGYDIRGIRPPTVPKGTSRLRISITLNSSIETIEEMLNDLNTLLSSKGPAETVDE